MRTKAKVIELCGRGALVEVERSSACEGCHKSEDGKGCSVCSLMGGDRKFSAVADNSIGAKIGDTVWVETETQRVLKYAALVFLLPILTAGLGFGIAAWCGLSTVMQALFAAIGFVTCFIGLFIYSGILQKKRFDIKIVEIEPHITIN